MYQLIQYCNFIIVILFLIAQAILYTVQLTRMFIYIGYWTLNIYYILSVYSPFSDRVGLSLVVVIVYRLP